MTSSLTNVVSLHSFILRTECADAQHREDMSILFGAIELASKVVSNALRRAPIEHLLGDEEAGHVINVQGEVVKKLDLIANAAFMHALTNSEQVCAMASEEEAEPMIVEERLAGRYVVAFDPLDGSSNIDANVSVGSIFAIWTKASGGATGAKEDLLQAGGKMVAAGYALYGCTTMLVFSIGGGVHSFTLDQSLGTFVLTQSNLQVPHAGHIYSVNEGNHAAWDEPTRRYVDWCKAADAATKKKPFSARYIGSMVADVHRTILYGGVFMYPADRVNKSGKLRYLYEVAPLSFLMEKAGGRATTGLQRALDIVPTSIHQRVPIFMGSADDIRVVEKFYATAGAGSSSSSSTSATA